MAFAFVGSVTGDPGRGETGPGVSVVWVEPASGALELRQQVRGLHSPTYLALHPRLPVRVELAAQNAEHGWRMVTGGDSCGAPVYWQGEGAGAGADLEDGRVGRHQLRHPLQQRGCAHGERLGVVAVGNTFPEGEVGGLVEAICRVVGP